MKDVQDNAAKFLNEVFELSGFDLRATAKASGSGHVLDIDGADASFLRSSGGELLDAVEHLVNQAFIRSQSQEERLTCDVNNFRGLRETELRAMARHAADRVHKTGTPFTFGPMNANERRIIHLELAGEETLRTESVGEGNERRLKVSLK